MPQQSLPAGIKVIFVDWHGVLTRDPFWISILQNSWHPLHQQLTNAAETLFTQKNDMVRDWMRGNLTANQIVATLKITPSHEFPPNYLIRKLVHDCQLMQINGPLIQFLQEAQKAAIMIVLATDNMDCFHEAIQRARQQKPRSTQQRLCETTSFVAAAQLFDDILCSSEQGVLKREDPRRFFKDWLNRHSLDFRDALLVDDLEINCNAFRCVGGSTLQMTIEPWRTDSDPAILEFFNRLQTKLSNKTI